jgi:hypothetical protein
MSFNETHAGDKPLAPCWMRDANAVNLAPVETGRVRRMAELGTATISRNSSRHKCCDTNAIVLQHCATEVTDTVIV